MTVENNLFPTRTTGYQLSRSLGVLYAFSVPFDAIGIFGGRSASLAIAVLLIGVFTLETLKSPERRIHIDFYVVATGFLWLIWISLSMLWALDLSQVALLLIVSALSWLTAVVMGANFYLHGRAILVAYVLGTAAIAFATIQQPVSIDGRRTFYADPNELSIGLAIGLVCALYLFAFEKAGKRRMFFALAAVLIGSGILATGSRTGLIALMVAVSGVLFFAIISARVSQRAKVSLLVVVLSSSTWFLSSEAVSSRLVDPELWNESSTWLVRLEIWRGMIDATQPIIGVGYGSDVLLSTEVSGLAHVAHNTWVGQYVQGGIIGLALFLGVICAALRHTFLQSRLPLVIPSLAVVLVGSLTLSLETNRSLWLVLALCMAGGTSFLERESKS